MNPKLRSTLIKSLKIIGIAISCFLLILFITPFFLKDGVSAKIKTWAGKNLRGKLTYSDVGLSFFKHFPSLTLTLYDFNLNGSSPYTNETLVGAKEIALGIDLESVFAESLKVDQIFLSDAAINILVNEKGEANYNVYVSSAEKKDKKAADSSSMSLKIEKILITHSHLTYNDRSFPMLIKAKGLNYTGKGDLSKDLFDLFTVAKIDSLDFSYDGISYFLNKEVNAQLVTRINTNSFALLFQKNDLKINKLPVQFNGRFEFLDTGYDMDFRLTTKGANLSDLFTAFPPEYQKWLDKTQVEGTTDVTASVIGKYISDKNQMPDFNLNMKVRNGLIANQKVPSPVKNLFLNMDASLPGFNPDSAFLKIDSLFFNIDKDYFSSIIKVKGLKDPYIYANINSELDLEKWQKAYGVSDFSVKGKYSLHLLADGKYSVGPDPTSLRKRDTVILSIPKFTLRSSLRNGYFKYASLPQSVNNISFNINGACADHNIKNANIAIENLNATILKNYIKGFLKINGSKGFPMEADLKANFNMADLKQVYPMDSLDLRGMLTMDVVTSGKYDPAQRQFPHTKALVSLKDGSVKTKYYPNPIENIQINSTITNNSGTLRDLKVDIDPLTFSFEGKPFTLKADLVNFDDMVYDVKANGQIDMGRIYKVFSRKGLNVDGRIDANLALRGRQSDAQKGNYARLKNSGTLKLINLTFMSELFPKPFKLQTGIFSFKDDKVWFDKFKAIYGQTDFELNGYLTNVINYAVKNELLVGAFDLKSNYFLVDEFMAFAGDTTEVSGGESGVVILPKNLNMTFDAFAKKVKYDALQLDSCQGQMIINNGQLALNKTGFNLIGCKVVMDATYVSVSPRKANFSYKINAQDFDVQRAYKEIKIFHDLAPAAAKAQGVVSLKYQLQGRLNADMMPVYPSLVGAGVLSIKDVKIAGLKMLTAVSKSTGKDEVNNPNLKGVKIKTSIKNNVINIEKTKFKIAGFRPKIEGQTTFDGRLNLKFRLGLPPFGIIGIPMTITGTRDNPIVKMGKETTDEKEMETEDQDDESVQDSIKH
ncbi:AsmA-like C-terminal region-containing protein [Solitalea sp. MAHUQ-68]|uniref:AsmA-like C-terminal region-containing protein n=1 Tax=Solitalea agri TaxID=2953739 RepID=A0A9X2F6V8_9SPHI|nr:AsmA-like C-terminal region-containing protein [Solitalea agri]MCO4291793.1 AsmA-like C-terminal region-containing protein [Solitalea agri]